MKISICIPVYNGSQTIRQVVQAVRHALADYETEIILVNDGSQDESEAVCEKIVHETEGVIFLSLRKNFGEHNAVMCALHHVTGDYAAIIDDDFQNPPAEILKMIHKAEDGYDVVYAEYLQKKHSWFRNAGSRFNDIMATWLLKKPQHLYLASFKVIRADLIRELIEYHGPFPYIDGLILRATNRVASVVVEHNERMVGRSNYTLYKLISLWLNMFINFSVKPLRVFTLFGILLAVISFIAAITFAVEKLLHPQTPLGWTSLAVMSSFFAGIQCLFLGLASEYIGKLYLDVNKTPQWSIRKIVTSPANVSQAKF